MMHHLKRRTWRIGIFSLRGCRDGPHGDRSDAHGVYPACEAGRSPARGQRGSVRCEATHNAEAASEAVRVVRDCHGDTHMEQSGAKRRTM